MALLFPGDSITEETRNFDTIRLGRGLQAQHVPSHGIDTKDHREEEADGEMIKCTVAGYLRRKDDKFWIDSPTLKSYFSVAVGDKVIGRIVGKTLEFYRVDIGAARYALLDALEFEGATKRNRPHIQIGALVYAHVKKSSEFMESEISCVNSTTQKADGYGELVDGYMLKTGILYAKSLLNPKHPLLSRLGSLVPFELAIGFNGLIWVKSQSLTNTWLIYRAIEEFPNRKTIDVTKFVDEIFSTIQ